VIRSDAIRQGSIAASVWTQTSTRKRSRPTYSDGMLELTLPQKRVPRGLRNHSFLRGIGACRLDGGRPFLAARER